MRTTAPDLPTQVLPPRKVQWVHYLPIQLTYERCRSLKRPFNPRAPYLAKTHQVQMFLRLLVDHRNNLQ